MLKQTRSVRLSINIGQHHVSLLGKFSLQLVELIVTEIDWLRGHCLGYVQKSVRGQIFLQQRITVDSDL